MHKFLHSISMLCIGSVMAVAQQIDQEKVTYNVGEGTSRAIIVTQWNEKYALENLALGYKFDGSVTAGEVLRDILKTDPRFYAVETGGKLTGIAFDLNGDRNTSFTDGTVVYSLTDGVASLPAGVIVLPTDSIGDQYGYGEWSLIRNSVVLADDATLNDGDVVYLCCNASEPAEHEYVMYLPDPEDIGVWLPEKMTLPIADIMYARFIIGTGGKAISTLSYAKYTAAGKSDASVLKAVKMDPDKTAARMLFTFTGTKESVGQTTYLHLKMKLAGETVYHETEPKCAVTAAAPEIPLERIYFKNPTMDNARLDRKIDLEQEMVFEPANATYTAWTGKATALLPTATSYVLSYSSSTGRLVTTTVPGTGVFTVTHPYGNLSAEMTVTSSCHVPVTDIVFTDEEIERTRTINMTLNDDYVWEFDKGYKIIPEDPDCIKYCTITIPDYINDKSIAGLMQQKVSHEKWGVVYTYSIMLTGEYGERTIVAKCEPPTGSEGIGHVYKEYKLVVAKKSTTGVDEITGPDDCVIRAEGQSIRVIGAAGVAFTLYNMSGVPVMNFIAEGSDYTTYAAVTQGIYLLRGDNGLVQKIAIR